MEKIWLSTPHMGGHEQGFVQEAFDTNWIAPLGPNVDGFENDLKEFLDESVEIAALSSGTAAIHLGLKLLGVEHDDEVLCQSFTFCGSANPIVYLGAKPIFIDSEEETWNICPAALREAIEDRLSEGKKPKAIIAVHLYGMPYRVEEIRKISEEYDIPVLEDAAEALGSTYKGKKCGTFGKLAVLSFNGNKMITTSGGGALVCPDQQLKSQAVFLATQARDDAPHYEHSVIGHNYRLSNISAGIGRGQMMVLDDRVNARRDMNTFYHKLFDGVEGISLLVEPDKDFRSNHWLSCVTVDSSATGFTRDELVSAFAKANIETRPLWKPMHLQPVFNDAPFYGGTVAERLFEKGLCLPSGSNLTEEDKQRISDTFSTFLKTRKE